MKAFSKSDQTKAHIMRAAIALFTERGFAGCSLRDIATAAGLNMGLIRYHFGSKADLYRDTLSYLAEPYNRACLTALHETLALDSRSASDILYAWLAAPYTHWDEEGSLVDGESVLRFLNKMGYESSELTRDVYESHFSFALEQWHDALVSHYPQLGRGDWFWCLTCLRGMYFNVVAHNDFTLWSLPAIHGKESALYRLADDVAQLLASYERKSVL